jgi:hypothetical protein
MQSASNLQPQIFDFLTNHKDLWGSKLVVLLLSRPDEPFHVIRLSHFINPPDCQGWHYEQFTRKYENCCGILQTDTKTLKDIDKRLVKLIAVKAELVVNKLNFTEVETEMQNLLKYRKETTKTNGRIKNFRQEIQNEVQRHRIAFTRLLDKALVECPEAYYLFKQHVQKGKYYKWVSFPDAEDDSLRKQPKPPLPRRPPSRLGKKHKRRK